MITSDVLRLPAMLLWAAPLFATNLFAQQSEMLHSDRTLGKVEFSISCTPAAQAQFERGLALLHHMMYEQAEQAFTAVTTMEPDCAMPYWGIAMTMFHPLWVGQPNDSEVSKAWAAIERTKALSASDRERSYIAAVETLYRDWQTIGYDERLAVWATAQEKIYRENPGDLDAAAFYALARLATAPKGDETFSHQKDAGQLLEKLHEQSPHHPAGFHYLIHAYDNPVLAARAVEVARGYDQLAPNVPHALHMPSHIFVRLGMWEDTIAWNRRSADAAKRQPVGGKTSLHYAHAMDYLIYAHLQRGEDQLAQKALKELSTVNNHQDNFASAYGVAAARARYPLERAQWAEAALLPVRMPPTVAWNKYPAAVAISHFARGLGAARSDNLSMARQAITALDAHCRIPNRLTGRYSWRHSAPRSARG